MNVTKMPNGQQLSVGQITENYDSAGSFTGAVGTSARVTTGFSYTIDASQLSSASATGSDLPATTCTYDTNYDLIGCVDSTIDVDASWIGQGNASERALTIMTEPAASWSRRISRGSFAT